MSAMMERDCRVTCATLDRLRRTKHEAAVRDARAGDRAGREFGLNRGEWRHLQMLEEMAGDFEDADSLDFGDDSAECLVYILATRLRQHGEDYGVDELREALFPGPARRYSADFTVAFVQSAAGVFREIVEQI